MLYTKSELKKALFFEIVTKSKPHSQLAEEKEKLWEEFFHSRYNKNSDLTPEETYTENAKFVPEFGEIVSISLGVINDDMSIEIVSSEKESEKDVLLEVANFMNNTTDQTAAGYNLSNYSIPYLIKRMLVNRVPIPYHLQLRGKKPWEINMIDVMKDYQGTTFESLRLKVLANTLGVSFTDYDEKDPIVSTEHYLKTVIDCAIAMSL